MSRLYRVRRFDVRVWMLAVLLASVVAPACGTDGPTETSRVQLSSTEGNLEVVVELDDAGRLSYTVLDRGVVVVESSPLGLLASTHDLTSQVRMFEGPRRRIDEAYTTVTGKRRERRVVADEVTLPLLDKNQASAELIVRAHDDGVAFRYRLLGEGTSTVMEERTGFAIPQGARALLRPYDDGREIAFIFTAGSYEQPPELTEVPASTETSGYAFPSLFEIDAERYVMVTEADLDDRYCGTRLSGTPESGAYRVRFPDEREGRGVGSVLPSASLPIETPWRVMVTGDLSTIVESTIVEDLSRPTELLDSSWIQPGRAAWSWFSQETGSPLLQSEYIDFAEEHGWEYVLIDANWDRWEDAERAVRALVAEADAGGVRLFLWYNSGGEHASNLVESPLDRMLDPATRRAEMQRLLDWRIAGIKVDFFGSDKQDRIAQHLGILRDAADYRLLVNFHGTTVPRGWQRTYPHLMTHEAVNGAEFYKDDINLLGDRAPTALTNVHHVLLRNVVGSMDYTPVTFEAALEKKALPYAHSLALSVLFESGIQHFADRADSARDEGYRAVFERYPFAATWLSTVPVAWDDTRLLTADLAGHVVLARRRGDAWYLAGIHAGDEIVSLPVSLAFLDSGTYSLELIEQGPAPDSLEHSMQVVDAGVDLAIRLPPRGGFTGVLRPDP